jgi:stage IV sporulation protein A
MEENLRLYEDIAKRTDGDIYVGVVGPVRTGKSTFIKKFMDLLVIPNIDNEYKKERARDELPQSAAGRTIMTTEPKFIPNEAVEITVGNNIKLKTRLVDCVGYLVNNAIGYLEDDMPRMVKTPWSDEEIPFERAAEIGTKKVIEEHSTIGILVTTDGSITDIPREDYIDAEERVVRELQELNKPFIIVLNSDDCFSDATKALARKLEDKYGVPVMPTNCAELNLDDINAIFGKMLYEFPIERLNINFPRWVDGLCDDHWLKKELYSEIKDAFQNVRILKQVDSSIAKLQNTQIITSSVLSEVTLGTRMC